MTLADFEQLPLHEKNNLLFSCCGSYEWVKSMLEILPVDDMNDLLEYAEEKWYECSHSDWLEAIENHARLGDSNSLAKEDAPHFGRAEQMTLFTSDPALIKNLKGANDEYEEIFGYMFISFAPGKSAEELLAELEARLHNDPREEIQIAADEQNKITIHRLKKLFSEEKVAAEW